MWYAIIAVLVLVLAWFWLGKRRGDSHVTSIVHLVAQTLRDRGEKEETIKAYLNSMEFATLAKSSFGSQAAVDVAGMVVARFEQNAERWRNIGNS